MCLPIKYDFLTSNKLKSTAQQNDCVVMYTTPQLIVKTCDQISNMLRKCGGIGQTIIIILIYKVMANLVLLKSDQKKVTVEEAESLLFCILMAACLKTYRRLQLSHSFPMGEDYMYLIFLTTCTHLFNQITNDCIVEILYCCPLNTLQSRCKIDSTPLCEYMETRWIHNQEGPGEGQESQTPAHMEAHKDGRAGGNSSCGRKQSALHNIGSGGRHKWTTFVP